MNSTTYYRIISFIIIISFQPSCKKFVEIPAPQNKVNAEAVFSDSANATAGVTGMYISIMESINGFVQGGITLNTGLAADELYPSGSGSDDLQFYTNAVSAINNSPNGVFWQNGYILIYQANACIEGLSNANNLSNSLRNQLTGEAKLVRAFCYFNLVNLFGDVPLVISTKYTNNILMPRASKDSVYKQIIKDLTDAQGLMLSNYITAGRVRPNQYTASALLAKVYLYQKDWQKAEALSTQIISNSSTYNLVANLNSVFLAGSKEAIWQLLPVLAGFETSEGYVFVPTSTTVIPPYVINNSLLTSFESTDQRKTSWLRSNVVNSKTYYYPYKYKLGYDGNSTPSENYMLFRLGEQYLIRAEARAQQNNISGAQADINSIRNRAGLLNTTANDQLSLLKAIAHERQTELFCELGNRWYDLKRTGAIDSTMAVQTPLKGGTWTSNMQLFPVPFSQMTLNSALTQNLGY